MAALGEMVVLALVQQCAPSVAPSTLNAIIAHESQRNPYAIGVNSAGIRLKRQPSSAYEAARTARELMAKEVNFDAGLGQINSSNFARLGLTPETVFDPCTNIKAAARVLTENYQSAKMARIARPLDAAISAYNTGSMTGGLRNGYVGKVYQQAGLARPAAMTVTGGHSVATVSSLLRQAFGARITDTLRPMNADYGADNSYHKYGQAVDFVPQRGMMSISKAQVRAVLEQSGVVILELLGPGDPGHDDHYHVAFAIAGRQSGPRDTGPLTLAGSRQLIGDDEGSDGVGDGPVMLSAIEEEAPPPAWDVFAVRQWQLRKAGQ